MEEIKLTKLLLQAEIHGTGQMQEAAVVKWERCREREG